MWKLSIHDEQVLRLVAGYIPFALKKRYRRMSSDTAQQYVDFLEKLKAKGDDKVHADSFLDYTTVWTNLQNRGGLFLVHDGAYKFFRAMEIITRTRLSEDLLIDGRDAAIKDRLYQDVVERKNILTMWEKLHENELVNDEQLLKTIVHYWVNIRLRAVVKLFLERKKKETQAHKGEKSLRKKLKGKK